jgi:pimeloyl-ACP methyl ester carboxylesterase
VTSTIVLLHAFPLNKSLWDGVTGPVAEAGWDVVVPDLRGFGESSFGGEDLDDEPDLAWMARDVLEILDRIGVEQAVIAGSSMGGYVAMELFRQAPQRVSGLVLIDTKATADTDEARANRLRVADQVESAGSTEALSRAMLPNLVGVTTHDTRADVVEQVRTWILEADPYGVAWAQRAMAARPDSHATLANVSVPALVLWGSEDAISPRPEQDSMVAVLPRSRAVEIPGCGHLAPIESPDAVSAALVEFLASI